MYVRAIDVSECLTQIYLRKKKTYERFLYAQLICDRELTQKGAKDIYNDVNTKEWEHWRVSFSSASMRQVNPENREARQVTKLGGAEAERTNGRETIRKNREMFFGLIK